MILLCLVALLTVGVPGETLPELLVRIQASAERVPELEREFGVMVTDAGPGYVIAYAQEPQVGRLGSAGFRVAELTESNQYRTDLDLQNYHTFAQVCSMVHELAISYPAITRLDTIGLSVNGRVIQALLVSDNPLLDENEPSVRLVGTHHGNEKISTEVTLAFAQYLCENYGLNSQVQALVDGREIWVIPILNPDGHVADQRANGNGIDLNRDYGYEWEVYSEPFTQPETRAMLAHSDATIPVLEYAYHSAASYVNYLWDNHPADPPDSAWIVVLSQRYADSTYGSSTTELHPINGFNWYEVHGSCQDNTFGIYGGLAWTIETREPSTRPKIDSICEANRRALLEMILTAGWGISGLVRDSVTGEPLFARVEFLNPERWHTYTDLGAGDFHKMLAPGTYELRVTANGYVPKTVGGVVVSDTGAAVVEVLLAQAGPDPELNPLRVVTVRRVDDSHVYRDWVLEALGPSDSSYYTLGSHQSSVVFEADPPVYDREGNDVAVQAENGYYFAVANDWQGPWQVLGQVIGPHSFDLAFASMDSARFLRVMNDNNALLDGISYYGPQVGTGEAGLGPPALRLAASPNPARTRVLFSCFGLSGSPAGRIRITDAAGRTRKTLEISSGPGSRAVSWDLRADNGRRVGAGVYFCQLESGTGSSSAKLVLSR